MKPRIAIVICRIAGTCAIVAALLAAGPTLRLLRGLDPPSMLYPFLIGAVATWILLIVGGIGLLYRRTWAFVLIYMAAGLNYFAGLSFVPFLQPVANSVVGSHAAVQAVNLIVVALLVWAHVAIRGRPAYTAFSIKT